MSNNRKIYDFKSVGQTQESFTQQQQNSLPSLPIGILTPVNFASEGDAMFQMSYDVKTQVRDNMRNMLQTNAGERLMLTDFGANLRPLAFELSNDDIAAEATRRIAKTTSKYMPFVELDTFETRSENSTNGTTAKIVVRVSYSIPNLGVTNQVVEAIIYAVG